MGMQVPYRLYTKVSEENNLQGVAAGHTADHQGSVQVEGNRDHRRTYDAGPRAFAGERAAKVQYLTGDGISKRKKCNDDI